MKRLAEQAARLQQAAEAVCTDPSLVYDTIYFAVIKTKQKYKKLANKERAVDVCISLMQQPRKHVKESFSSVEDCIEKALSAKVVPWRWIVSAVAVVLAVAIILPFCLPEKPLVIDPAGFVMENTESFGNSIGENETYVKNYHNLKDLGGPDNAQLAGENYWGGGGHIKFELLTMENGSTYMAYVYAKREQGKAPQCELILYRADATGWLELGRLPVVTFVERGWVAYEGGDTVEYEDILRYSTGAIALMEYDNTLYIASSYDEGIQIHRYTDRKGIEKVDEAKIGKKMNFGSYNILYDDNWIYTSMFCFNEAKEQFDFVYCIRTQPDGEDLISIDTAHKCFISFDPKTETLSEPVHRTEPEYLGGIPMTLFADEDGFLYYFDLEPTGSTTEYEHSSGPGALLNHGLCLYRYNGESLERIGMVSDPKVDAREPRLCRFKDGVLEVIYEASLSYKRFDYVRIVNDVVVERRALLPSRQYYTHEYLGFFYLNDEIYCLEMYEEGHLVLSRAMEKGRVQPVAEIAMPQSYSYKGYNYQHRGRPSIHGNIFNYLFVAEEDIYFGQVLCDPLPVEEES